MSENKIPKFSNTSRSKIGRATIKFVDECAASKLASNKYQESVRKHKETEEFKQSEKRAKLLQRLDKSNKKVDEQTKYANILQFVNATVDMIANDYNKLSNNEKQNILYIIDVAKRYATHVKVIRNYTENKWEYGKNVLDLFVSRVRKINPKFIKFFKLETIVLMSL